MTLTHTDSNEIVARSTSPNDTGEHSRNEKLVPWGTDGRLPLSGDFLSLIVEQSLTFRRVLLTNLYLHSNFVSNQIKFLKDTFSSKFKVR